MLVNIANAQVEAGAEVGVLIINDNWEETLIGSFDKRVRLLYMHKRMGSGNPWFVVRMNRILTKEDPDVIHLHAKGLISLLFSKNLRRKACATLHDVPSGAIRRKGWIYKIIPMLDITQPGNVVCIDKVGQVFAISQTVHDELLEKYGVESRVVCNGIPTSLFRQRGDRQSSVPLRIVQVSRIEHEKKGQDLLIRAVASMKGKVSVDFVGIGSSMEYLKKLAEKLDVSTCIKFLGKKTQKEVKAMLADYDLFVQPSRYEGFGLTVAEGMAAGLPVLVSAGQGPAEVTCGDLYGWTFENGNVNSLVSTIEHISSNYGQALDKAKAAYKHVKDTYDVSVTANHYLDEYKRLIDMRKVNIRLTGGVRIMI